MKLNYFIILLIVTLSSLRLQSQELLKEGNLWTYFTLDYISGNISPTHYKVNGDTLINNVIYKKIYSKSEETNNIYELENYFVRQDIDGKSFKINSNLDEILLIDNKLIKDDSFFAQANCEFTLDRTQSLQLNNNNSAKKLIFSYLETDPITNKLIHSSTSGFQWLENIGNLKLPFYGPSDYCPPISQNNYFTALACFTSDDVLVYGTKENCSDFVSKAEEEDITSISIYPNPIGDEFIVEFDKNQNKIKQVSISDMNGKLVYTNNDIITQKTIIISQDFPCAMYIVNIHFSLGQVITKKIVKI